MATDDIQLVEVTTLFQQCLEFCAKNMEHIESLIGFPEEISEQILEQAIRLGSFNADGKKAASALSLFAACGGGLFSDIQLENILVLNNYELTVYSVLAGVRQLNLTGLHLDDDHDILSLIPECPNLTTLILERSKLTERGLKKVTYPGFGGKKLPLLSYLDLSGVSVSMKYMRTLRHLPQLQRILLFSEDKVDLADVPGFSVTTRPQLRKVTPGRLWARLLSIWTEATEEVGRTRQEAVLRDLSGFYFIPSVYSPPKPVLKEETRNKVMLQRINNLDPSKLGPQLGINNMNHSKLGPQLGINNLDPSKLGPQQGINNLDPSKLGPPLGISYLDHSKLKTLQRSKCLFREKSTFEKEHTVQTSDSSRRPRTNFYTGLKRGGENVENDECSKRLKQDETILDLYR